MSSAANSSSLYQATEDLAERESMLASGSIGISVISRVDYNLRFAKQAVLVVSNNAEQYSQLASQFLVSLSNIKPTVNHLEAQDDQINVAFISASSKLNDIQMRCRLIEQLFVNTLFDPEQSLAVSVLRFAKQHGEAISIVIDHAHALSLQVKYELCQLVALAKKNKLTINVVLFGLTEAAQQLAINKSLFKSKLVVIEAATGQVISLDDKTITLKKDASPLLLWQKLSLVSAMVLLTVTLIWVYLLIAEDVNQQALQISDTTVIGNSSKDILLASSSMATSGNESESKMKTKYKNELEEGSLKESASLTNLQATSEEINQALMSINLVNPINKMPAAAVDVLKALVIADNKTKVNVVNITSKEVVNQRQVTNITNNYYQTKAKEYKEGYAVQIAGFSDKKLLKRFLSLYPEDELYSYQRMLNDKSFTVITSKVFQNKADAKAAIQLLPIQLIERKPWVKSISSIINEINTFTR